MSHTHFSKKKVWITGASSGIGEALVFELAKQGAQIVLSARNESALQAIAQKTNLSPENYLIIPFDLADTSKADEYVQQIIQKFGRIDVLINNGGMSQRGEAVATTNSTERNLFEINYFAQVALAKAVLPVMIKQQSGQITVISSIAGKFGFYLRSTYSAAKHALHGYFESLRLEVEKNNIQVLLVCPGKIKTNISNNAVLVDGSKHAKMDESHINAMTANECARQIITAIEKNKHEIFVGGKEIFTIYIKRFFPKLFYKIIKKQSPY
ncbi:MAG TPA: SDR family oxidoreductase [Bacteroidia bacterium]|nr:SDR family oxidoreductase [Bacteroidia bacterium]